MVSKNFNDIVLGRKRHASVYQICRVLTRPLPWPKATLAMEPEKQATPPESTATTTAPAPKSALGFRLNPLVLFPGLAASFMLLADYTRAAPVFCTEAASGCAALRNSAFSHLGPIPLPVLGLLGLLSLLALGLVRGKRAAALHAAIGAGSVAAALLLLGVQLTRGQFCEFCLVVDASALAAGLIGVTRFTLGWQPPERVGPRVAQGVIMTVLVSLTGFMALTKEPPIPSVVREELAKTPKGKVLVLDFLDFECPYCRDAHVGLKALLAEHADQVRIVRKHVPLSLHPHAEPAARAALCAERMGKGNEMLERLFEIEPKTMSSQVFTEAAVALGLDGAAFGQCLADPALKERLDADRASWKSLGAQGLPTVYVGTRRFVGAIPADQVLAAIEAGR